MKIQNFTEVGTYEGTVHRISNICTFLPIIFDEFGGFTVTGVYQSTILEYRFETTGSQGEFACFSQYLQAATRGRSFSFIQSVEKHCGNFTIITVAAYRASFFTFKRGTPTYYGCLTSPRTMALSRLVQIMGYFQ